MYVMFLLLDTVHPDIVQQTLNEYASIFYGENTNPHGRPKATLIQIV